MPPRSSTASPYPVSADTRILVLHGEEEMRKRECLDALRAALHAQHGDVGTVFFDGKTAPLVEVLDELRTYSLLQPYKLVLVDQAAEFIKRLNYREALERYAAAPVDHATLVLRSDGWYSPKLDKAVAKVGAVVKCERLKPAEARAWALRQCPAHHGRTLAPAAAAALVNHLGPDLMLIDSELGKLSALVGEGQGIEAKLVEELVGRSSEEEAWAIQEAVLSVLTSGGRKTAQQRAQEMLQKVHELVDLAGNDTVPITWALTELSRKICVGLTLKRQGASDEQITNELKIHWGLQKTAIPALLRQIDAPKAQRWYDRMIELDRRGKSGFGDRLRHLECFCTLLADEWS